MKRWVKWCLGAAGVLAVLGLTLRSVGFFLGGREENRQYFEQHWEEDWADLDRWSGPLGPIHVGSDGVHIGGENGIHVDSGGVSVGGENGIQVGHRFASDGEKQTVESGALTGITHIEVDVDCVDIEIREGEELSVSLEWNLSNYEMRYQVEGGVLKVEDESWGSAKVGELNIDCTVTITLPAGTDLEEIALSSDMGDIHIDTAATARKADISTDMGDVQCRGLQAREMEADTDLGDVTLSLPGGRENYNWELETSLGELRLNGQKQSGGMGEIQLRGGTGENSVQASSSLGDVEVSFSQ